ncbi:MAG: helix-turn-helix domain-containing protein [Acidimicrobiia bacterium]
MRDTVSEVAFGRPAPPLRSAVEEYIGYRFEGFPPGVHRGLPGRHLTFVISLGDPVDIAAMPDPRHPPMRLGAFVAGLDEGPAMILHGGNQYGIALELTPVGARSLLGLPAGELSGLAVGLEDLFGRRAGPLVDRLATAPTWAERFDALDRALLSAASRLSSAPARAEVVLAWDRLVATGGAVEVGALARELGWSRRHLGERFRCEIGLSPKALARVVRFERSRRLLARPDHPRLADVAVRVGYYDQAHLNREWRVLAGCSPTTWMAEELPAVQDPAPAPG